MSFSALECDLVPYLRNMLSLNMEMHTANLLILLLLFFRGYNVLQETADHHMEVDTNFPRDQKSIK